MFALGRLVARRLPIALVGGLITAAIYLATGPRQIAASPVHAALTPSPETIGFLAAYASGDERAADALASPLYRAEWGRRGVGVAARIALRGLGDADDSTRKGLRFEYVGGVRSSEGFSHLLYLVTPIGESPGSSPVYSAWRVDADPRGRVIWLELVWLFGADARDVVPIADAGLAARVPVPTDAAEAGLTPVLGVRSETTGEGHYVLGPTAGIGSVSTYSVDSDGAIRPGAWSFGTADWSARTYPPSRSPGRRIEVAPEDQPMLGAYLRAIEQPA